MTESPIVILDFGSQFTQLIARTVRGLGVYCEIEPYSINPKNLIAKQPRGLILSGGPASVGTKAAPGLVKSIFQSEYPILGICYGMQLLSHAHAGKLQSGKGREYGFSEIEVLKNSGLFCGFEIGEKIPVWMSHGDSVEKVPEGASITARSEACPVAALEMGHLHAVQFHPEVAHTPTGSKILSNFLFKVVRLRPQWKMENFFLEKTKEIEKLVGTCGVMGAISGGVDSTLLAIFLNKILGKKFHPILVDNGLMRLNEVREVSSLLARVGVKLRAVDSSRLFLKRLQGISNPELKRRIIGKTFIEVFEKECRRLASVKFLAQGTLYPDVIESVSVKGPSQKIKTHHNVGGLPRRMKLRLIEPFRNLFKDEVRELGRGLGVPEDILGRHPFPGPGLAVRVLGSVTEKRLSLLRQADAIFTDELRKNSLYPEIWQAFAVLLPVKAVGVMGDARTYESVIALRAVTSRDGMTADWFEFKKPLLGRVANRIINEVPGVNRVVYDISSKPPATIEWE